MTIEDSLKELIKSRYKSVNNFAIELNKTQSSINNILIRGIQNARFENIALICTALNIDINGLYKGVIVDLKEVDNSITLEESEMLKKFRALDSRGITNVKTLLDSEYNSIKE